MDYHQLHQSRLRRRRDPDQIPQPLSLIGLELTELIAPGILTRWIGNSSLLGVKIWLPSDYGATTCCELLSRE
jgi:hypothetical protein